MIRILREQRVGVNCGRFSLGRITKARVAKLADAPDLGLRNRRFQSVSFRFKASVFYEGKTNFSDETVVVANGE
jgi:hypothetical protein